MRLLSGAGLFTAPGAGLFTAPGAGSGVHGVEHLRVSDLSVGTYSIAPGAAGPGAPLGTG